MTLKYKSLDFAKNELGSQFDINVNARNAIVDYFTEGGKWVANEIIDIIARHSHNDGIQLSTEDLIVEINKLSNQLNTTKNEIHTNTIQHTNGSGNH